MAGFTTMALLGAGALGGAIGGSMLSRRRQQQQQQQGGNQQQLAPAPTDSNLAAPAPPIVNPADANAQAIGAANKQRKRTARGSLLTNPLPTSNTMPVAPRYAQRTLLGS